MDSDLCQSCGLCCDGSLFGRVGLEKDERRTRLRVVGETFEQPCAALTKERRCSIYETRPRACRRFACTLLERHRREGGPLAERIRAVQRVRELVRDARRLGADELAELERRIEADFSPATRGAAR